jgi:hypothetical protein
LALLEITAEEVSDGPAVGGEIVGRLGHAMIEAKMADDSVMEGVQRPDETPTER